MMIVTAATSQAINARMKARGINVLDLSEQTGHEFNLLWDKLDAKTAWTIEDIAKIAGVLECNPSHLIQWKAE